MNVTGNTSGADERYSPGRGAAMEPGERHREHTIGSSGPRALKYAPQWSPVNVTGNTGVGGDVGSGGGVAAMEPGEHHREHAAESLTTALNGIPPQWSPVNVTGNTSAGRMRPFMARPRRNGAR